MILEDLLLIALAEKKLKEAVVREAQSILCLMNKIVKRYAIFLGHVMRGEKRNIW